MPKIYIDADGCPVVYLTIDIAEEYGISCCIVCDSAHTFAISDIEIITVDQGRDSVDYKILNLINSGDIVVTQDYGLAAMALSKHAYPISQNGILYTEKNIDGLLEQRHYSAKQRKSSHRYPHIAKRTYKDDKAFMDGLCNFLNSLK